MNIRISKNIKNKLPKGQRNGLEEALRIKSDGKCAICEESFEPTDGICADHIVPTSVANSGSNKLENLQLAHSECNAIKGDKPHDKVKEIIKFKRFYQRHQLSEKQDFNYSNVQNYFQQKPRTCHVTIKDENATFHFSNGHTATSPIRKSADSKHSYVHMQVPHCYIFSDEEAQPRAINLTHVQKLYTDLDQNPLIESATARLQSQFTEGSSKAKILMFDGQHKATAAWLNNHKFVEIKIYLNMSGLKAKQIVESIQDRNIKKRLTEFEKIKKDGTIHDESFLDYTSMNPTASEQDYISSQEDKDKKNRAKAYLSKSLMRSALYPVDDIRINLIDKVRRTGEKKSPEKPIPERAFVKKILEPIFDFEPLPYLCTESQKLREQESKNVRKVLNIWYDLVFDIDPSNKSKGQRRTRMSYQPALYFVTDMIKNIFTERIGGERPLMKQLSSSEWGTVRHSIVRLVDHPCWTHPANTDKMRKIENALVENQKLDTPLRDVYLDLGYILEIKTQENLPVDWAGAILPDANNFEDDT